MDETASNVGLTRAEMDALVDSHYRAEEAGDIDAIVSGLTPNAEHDVPGSPGGVLHGHEQIASFYRSLLHDLEIVWFEPIRRWYGETHVADESLLHATASGQPFGLAGHGRSLKVRFLHIFDFRADLISRETAWVDLAALQHQLSD